MTVGITEEEQDSVHSLSPRNKGYYEWKQELCSKSQGGSLTCPPTTAIIMEEDEGPGKMALAMQENANRNY